MNASPQQTEKKSSAQRRVVVVHDRATHKDISIPASTHRRMCLLYAAVVDGLAMSPDVTWWSSLAPLKVKPKNERAWVFAEVRRLRALSAEERSAELLLMKTEGNIP